MKKHLVALLSMVGLAGTAAPAHAQVLKGSEPDTTKKESKIKQDKQLQEQKAAQEELQHKHGKGAAGSADAVAAKVNKSQAEKHAAGGQAQDKQKASDATVKIQKADTEAKVSKNAAEHKAAKANATIKGEKTGKDVNQASPK
jgi:hypothetical protein